VKAALTTVALPHLSLEETVDFASRLGYDGIELRVRYLRPNESDQPYSIQGNHKNDLNPANFVGLAPRVKKLCDERGLAIPALAARTTATELDDIRRLSEGAAICGCPLLRIGAPRRYDGTVPYAEIYAEAVDAFGKALEITRSFGVRGLLEIHGGTVTVSASLAQRLVANFPPDSVGVIYDLQNMVREGFEGLRLGLDVLGPYLAHVHVGGHAPAPGARDASGTLGWNWQATDLPDGLLAIPPLLAELRRVGYRGFITVEDLRPNVDPAVKFGAAIEYLRRVMTNE